MKRFSYTFLIPVRSIPLTEKLLAKFTELEPLFSMSTGAAMELFGFNPLRKMKRMERDAKARVRRDCCRLGSTEGRSGVGHVLVLARLV